MELTKRQDIPTKETWNLRDLFSSTEEWDEARQEVEQAAAKLSLFTEKIGERAENLLHALEAREAVLEKLVPVMTYASLSLSSDGTDAIAQGNSSLAQGTQAIVQAEVAKVDAEILTLPPAIMEQFQTEKEELQSFRVYLDKLTDTRPYALSSETEEVLAALSPILTSPYSTYLTSKSADMAFPTFTGANGEEFPLSFARFEDQYELSPHTEERRNAFIAFDDTLKKYEHTYAKLYASEVTKQVTLARLRGYESAEQMLLHSQNVTQAMYHNQLDTIYQELAPHMQRYAKLKKDVLGLDTFGFSDLKAPLDPEFEPVTSYEEAYDTIIEALEPFGEEYGKMLKRAKEERWVDRADNVGKATGAFCASPYGSHPYILLTWKDTMRGAFILAHELGHAGHFYHANAAQPLHATRPSTYCIEAPSTMNELFLGNHLLTKTDDPRMKRWITLQFIGTYYHNFVTHLLEGEFQRRVYALAEKGIPLTAIKLRETKQAVLTGFWGDSVEINERAGRTWMRQPHYYMGLYPYTYSAGLTAATKAYTLYQEQGQPVIDKWLDMLQAGGTLAPLDLFKQSGVDMESKKTIQDAVAYVGTLINDLVNSYK
ncbi:oligoendopeptidase F [Alkalihalobacillus sp. LMS6]|jgi:oligoendopeptidase F|uniref:oligoendopeptidase F n=1 Tax=Alkalihalobacillus sp. LMS6 TaxID=2924034 RepID=UPI0020D05781|nr:oligoendopeptidase F [Alkalihalobacillus sp. LMS6]UTR08255.1 oligoendopeptidase F [Alkalihalobacillus sp. LMS6]UTR08318.1 oligoendopeptidase F [Alkalihalobacillus sp. LMS6]